MASSLQQSVGLTRKSTTSNLAEVYYAPKRRAPTSTPQPAHVPPTPPQSSSAAFVSGVASPSRSHAMATQPPKITSRVSASPPRQAMPPNVFIGNVREASPTAVYPHTFNRPPPLSPREFGDVYIPPPLAARTYSTPTSPYSSSLVSPVSPSRRNYLPALPPPIDLVASRAAYPSVPQGYANAPLYAYDTYNDLFQYRYRQNHAYELSRWEKDWEYMQWHSAQVRRAMLRLEDAENTERRQLVESEEHYAATYLVKEHERLREMHYAEYNLRIQLQREYDDRLAQLDEARRKGERFRAQKMSEMVESIANHSQSPSLNRSRSPRGADASNTSSYRASSPQRERPRSAASTMLTPGTQKSVRFNMTPEQQHQAKVTEEQMRMIVASAKKRKAMLDRK